MLLSCRATGVLSPRPQSSVARHLLSLIFPALICAIPLAARAHSEGESSSEEDVYAMDCEHPPKDALRALPDEFARWARIMCMPTGHMLVQSANAQWRYPGSFTTKVMFPARTLQDENDGRPRYFTHVEVRALTPEEALVDHKRLLRENPLYADRLTDQVPHAAWEVVGTNNANVSYRILLMQPQDAQDIWATVCAPACEAQNTFIVTPYN